MELSTKDDALIALLRDNARLSVSEMARRMSASRTAVQMRLQKLERRGVIAGYTMKLSPQYTAKKVRALVMIKFTPANRVKIEAELGRITPLTSFYSISGEFDMAGVISAPSTAVLD